MSTLLFHTGALGDFVTTIPAIQYYKKQNPEEKITLLGKPAIGKFAKDIGLIDDWLDVDGQKFLPLFYDDFSGEAQRLLSAFSAAILFTGADAPISKNIAQSGIQRIFRQPPFPTSPQHIIDYHLSLFCNPETLAESDKIPVIIPPAEAFVSSENKFPADKSKPIAIHPGSGSKKKNWPFDRFLQVAGFFRSKEVPVLWIKGPAEDGFDFPQEDTIAADQPISVLAALLSRCAAYIGNDSGVTHLAAATGCRTVAVWGPSDLLVWGPRGKKVSIINQDMLSGVKMKDGAFQGIPWERIVELL